MSLSDEQKITLHLAEMYAHVRILLYQHKAGTPLSDRSLAKIEMIMPAFIETSKRMKDNGQLDQE